MAQPQVVAVGRAGTGPEATMFARYAMRLRPRLGLLEIPDGRGSMAEIRRRETAALLAALPAGAPGPVIALDQGGVSLDSAGWARLYPGWQSARFVLGGAEGLEVAVLARANLVLSLGPLTWPHLLARVMLAEQLYRAQSIATGHPYHRAGRP